MRHRYVRFVIDRIDPDSGRRRGIFGALYALLDSNRFYVGEREQLEDLRAWFHGHLDAPDRFSTSRKSGAASTAISWFKASANEHVSRMHELCRLLNERGIATEMLTSDRPGYIVFEDDHQVAALPFAETVT